MNRGSTDNFRRKGDASLVEAFLYLFAAFWLICLAVMDAARLDELTREDGLIENLSALFWLFGFAGSLVYLAGGNRRHRPVMIIFCALSFLCLGEEISWGQRIFDLATPGILTQYSAQKELSLHNLRVLTSGTSLRPYLHGGSFDYRQILNLYFVFRAGFFTYFYIFPFLGRWRRGTRLLSLIDYYPPRPRLIIISFLAISATVIMGIPSSHAHSAAETQEMCYALFSALYVFQIYRGRPASRRPVA